MDIVQSSRNLQEAKTNPVTAVDRCEFIPVFRLLASPPSNPECKGARSGKNIVNGAGFNHLTGIITATRSAIFATTARSWVIKMMDMFSVRCSSRISSRIGAWIVTSRAVVGSSAIRIEGLHARLLSDHARCSMPPENSNGYCLAAGSLGNMGLFKQFHGALGGFF